MLYYSDGADLRSDEGGLIDRALQIYDVADADCMRLVRICVGHELVHNLSKGSCGRT